MPVQDATKVQAANATLEVEFQAIRKVCEVLETLTTPQRHAVIIYVSQRFQRAEVELSGIDPDNGGPPPGPYR